MSQSPRHLARLNFAFLKRTTHKFNKRPIIQATANPTHVHSNYITRHIRTTMTDSSSSAASKERPLDDSAGDDNKERSSQDDSTEEQQNQERGGAILFGVPPPSHLLNLFRIVHDKCSSFHRPSSASAAVESSLHTVVERRRSADDEVEEDEDAARARRRTALFAAECLPYSPNVSTPSFQHIPLVDLSLPPNEISRLVDSACRDVGFLYVVHHGVDRRVVDRALAASRKFFDLPTAEKVKLSLENSRSGVRGYFAVGEEDLNGRDGTRDLAAEGEVIGCGKSSSPYRGDLKEGFDCGRDEITPDDPDVAACPALMDVNQWPPEDVLPEFRSAVLDYQRALLGVADKLLVAFAGGLGLSSRDFFVARSRRPMVTLRLLHYPPQEPTRTPGGGDPRMGCGAHTDYGLCTILHQDNVGGLQVRNADGEWIDAPPMPGSFVVNIGDMMSRWTDGVYSSTVHRVVNTSGRERYSMPFFFNPDVGTVVEGLGVVDETTRGSSAAAPQPTTPREKRVETSDEILLNRYRGTFKHMKEAP